MYFNGTARPGGAWESLKDIVSRIDRARFEPIVACSKAPAWSGTVDSVECLQVQMPMWRKGKNLPLIPFSIAKLRRELRTLGVSMVHANGLWDVPYAVWSARPFRIPVVAHIRTEVDVSKAKKYYVPQASVVITTSQRVAGALNRDGALRGRVRHLPNGVDLDRFDPQVCGEQVRDEYGISREALLFGAIGRIDKLKGLDLLVQAFSELSEKFLGAQLIIVGDSRGKGSEFGEILRSRVLELGLNDRVIFTGSVDDIVPVLSALDVLVMPSLTEGFGRSAVEAMAMKKPVIASDAGGLPEIVVNGKTGLVFENGNVSELSEKMAVMAQNKDRREAFGAAGRAVVEEKFDVRKMINRLERVYDDLLQSRALGKANAS